MTPEPGGSVAPAYVAFPAYHAWSDASAPWKFVAATADKACASARVTAGAAGPSLRDCAAKRYPPTATETSRSVTPSNRLIPSLSARRTAAMSHDFDRHRPTSGIDRLGERRDRSPVACRRRDPEVLLEEGVAQLRPPVAVRAVQVDRILRHAELVGLEPLFRQRLDAPAVGRGGEEGDVQLRRV